MISRFIYGILVAIAGWAYFMPWIVINGSQSMPGWAILPFTAPYFIGLVLGIVIFFTGYKAIGLSLFAGFCMIGSVIAAAFIGGLGAYTHSGQITPQLNFAFYATLAYLIIGSIVGSSFSTSGGSSVSSGGGLLSKLFWFFIIPVMAFVVGSIIIAALGIR